MFRSQESGHRPGKFFYLQDPGETERWLGPRPHPLWGPWEEGNGRARPENRDPSHFSFPVSQSVRAISHVALPQPPLQPHLG